jgi:hypothetical protein
MLLLGSGRRRLAWGGLTILQEDRGITPIVLDSIPSDDLACGEAGPDHATVAISMGGMLFRVIGRNKIPKSGDRRGISQDLSIDRSGRCRRIIWSIRRRDDSLMVIDQRVEEIYPAIFRAPEPCAQWGRRRS